MDMLINIACGSVLLWLVLGAGKAVYDDYLSPWLNRRVRRQHAAAMHEESRLLPFLQGQCWFQPASYAIHGIRATRYRIVKVCDGCVEFTSVCGFERVPISDFRKRIERERLYLKFEDRIDAKVWLKRQQEHQLSQLCPEDPASDADFTTDRAIES